MEKLNEQNHLNPSEDSRHNSTIRFNLIYLVISSDKSVILSLQSLVNLGVTILHVSMPLAGIQLAKNQQIDGFLLDISSDPKKGIIAYDLIKKTFPIIPIIIISDFSWKDTKNNQSLLLLDGLLIKPINKEEAIIVISQIQNQKLKNSNKQIKKDQITILGLKNSGKRSLINKYYQNSELKIKIISNEYIIENNSDNFIYKILDVGENSNDKLSNYDFNSTKGFMFIVDSTANIKQLEKAKRWFWELISHKLKLKNTPIILILNELNQSKSSMNNIALIFDISELALKQNDFYLIGASIQSGEGINEAFRWIFNKLENKKSFKSSIARYQSISLYDRDLKPVINLNNNFTVINSIEIEKIKNVLADKNNFEIFFVNNELSYYVLRQSDYHIFLKGQFKHDKSISTSLNNILEKTINLILPLGKRNDILYFEKQFRWLVKQDFPSFFSSRIQYSKDRNTTLLGIIITIWDEVLGPRITNQYLLDPEIKSDQIAMSCFVTTVTIFGPQGKVEPCFVTLPIKYANIEARIFFDSYKDSTVRGGERIYTIISLFSDISQVINLNKHDNLIKIFSQKFKSKQDIDFKKIIESLKNI